MKRLLAVLLLIDCPRVYPFLYRGTKVNVEGQQERSQREDHVIQIVKGKEYDRKRHVDKSDTLFAYISYPNYARESPMEGQEFSITFLENIRNRKSK